MAMPLEIDVTTAADYLRQGALLLDVREPHEVAICAVAGSQPIPLRQIPENLATLPLDQTILVMCHHGGRSERVTQFLRSKGYSKTPDR
jgi:adenylyltransferase/sulfurtransferase